VTNSRRSSLSWLAYMLRWRLAIGSAAPSHGIPGRQPELQDDVLTEHGKLEPAVRARRLGLGQQLFLAINTCCTPYCQSHESPRCRKRLLSRLWRPSSAQHQLLLSRFHRRKQKPHRSTTTNPRASSGETTSLADEKGPIDIQKHLAHEVVQNGAIWLV
jgi:hypothetical protein